MRSFVSSIFILLLSLCSIGFVNAHEGHDDSDGEQFGSPSIQFYHYPNGSATDLRLTITHNTKPGWTAVGFGSKMENALMFVLYPSSEPGEAVMSVRTADGHSMPQQYTEVQYDILKAYVSGGLMTGEIICYDCVSWPGGSLDISSATQPLIWANGPGEAVRSSSLNADIAMHQEHGHSQLNMAKHATTAEEANEDEGLVEPINEYGTPSGWPRGVKLLVYLHAWALGPMFVFMVPIAIMILRWPSNPSVRWHQMLQVLCAAIAVIGLLNTLSFSRQVPEWSSYGNFHQILGIFALVGLLCQAVLGWYNHRKFSLGERDRTQRTRSRLHIWAGRTILPLGMLNAVLGLRWAGKPGQAAMLVLIELFMLAGTAVIVWRWNRNAWRREKSGAMGAYGILNGGIEGTDVDEPFALHDIDEDDEDAEDDENDRKHHPSS